MTSRKLKAVSAAAMCSPKVDQIESEKAVHSRAETPADAQAAIIELLQKAQKLVEPDDSGGVDAAGRVGWIAVELFGRLQRSLLVPLTDRQACEQNDVLHDVDSLLEGVQALDPQSRRDAAAAAALVCTAAARDHFERLNFWPREVLAIESESPAEENDATAMTGGSPLAQDEYKEAMTDATAEINVIAGTLLGAVDGSSHNQYEVKALARTVLMRIMTLSDAIYDVVEPESGDVTPQSVRAQVYGRGRG